MHDFWRSSFRAFIGMGWGGGGGGEKFLEIVPFNFMNPTMTWQATYKDGKQNIEKKRKECSNFRFTCTFCFFSEGC
jgi:hypothetical protein